MSIQHKNIPDAQLHEPKGVSSASSGHVYTADGSGSGVWQLPHLDGQASADSTSLPTSDGSGGIVWKTPATLVQESTSEVIFAAYSDLLSQNPSGLDTPLQVSFGPAQNDSNDPVQITSAGRVIVNQSGTYNFKIALQYGRSSNTGVSVMLFRSLANGVQSGRTILSSIDQSYDVLHIADTALVTLPAGTEITYEIMRDSSGSNDGGLYGINPAVGSWDSPPSAYLVVSRVV